MDRVDGIPVLNPQQIGHARLLITGTAYRIGMGRQVAAQIAQLRKARRRTVDVVDVGILRPVVMIKGNGLYTGIRVGTNEIVGIHETIHIVKIGHIGRVCRMDRRCVRFIHGHSHPRPIPKIDISAIELPYGIDLVPGQVYLVVAQPGDGRRHRLPGIERNVKMHRVAPRRQ